MSDRELQAIRRQKLRELKRKIAGKRGKTGEIDADKVLNGIFRGRAWEIFNAASYSYPDIMRKLKAVLVELALSGRLKRVTGEQLYFFLNRNLGLRVRLDTKIRFTEHGKLKSLAEKIKEDLHRT